MLSVGMQLLILAVSTALGLGQQRDVAGIGSATPRFTANQGQWPPGTRFVVGGASFLARAEDDGVWLELFGRAAPDGEVLRTVLHVSFVGVSEDVELVGEGRLPGVSHYLIGNDPDQWRRFVHSFERIRWRNLRPGVDLVLGPGMGDEILRYEIQAEPGADASRIGMAVEGATSTSVDSTGRLRVETGLGVLRMTAPVAWHVSPDGSRQHVPSRFQATGEGLVLLDTEATRTDLPLVIDPGLTWASFLGGNMDDRARTVAVAPNGDVLVGGSTYSTDFPTTPGAVDVVNLALSDGFVSQLSGDGSALVFSTYIGGANLDDVHSLDLLPTGEIVVAGETRSLEFPTTRGAWDTTKGGAADGFVSRLAADGSSFVYSTFLGGSQDDKILEVQVDGSGAAIVAGETFSSDLFTTAGAYQPSMEGFQDAFLGELGPDGSRIEWLTFLGGESSEAVMAMRIGPAGNPIVLGRTVSSSFPTTPGVFDTTKSTS